ncbi:MAG: DNA-processing protein DprA, partial [Rhodanobacter sp.]
MDESAHWRDWLTALRTPGMGPGGLRERLQVTGNDIHAALAQMRRGQVACSEAARAWLRHPDESRLDADLAWLATPGHRLLRCIDADFPPQLEHIPQPPAALFVVGDTSALLYPQVAIVGARAASASGVAHAGVFARALAQAGFAVTSGLADGIDAAAHAATLEVGGLTLAVMGTGPDRVYPHKHQTLADGIAAHGALVSEFPPGTGPRADHFPRRNRLISGLSLGTVVVNRARQRRTAWATSVWVASGSCIGMRMRNPLA